MEPPACLLTVDGAVLLGTVLAALAVAAAIYFGLVRLFGSVLNAVVIVCLAAGIYVFFGLFKLDGRSAATGASAVFDAVYDRIALHTEL